MTVTYNVVNVQTGELVQSFPSGEEANAFARSMPTPHRVKKETTTPANVDVPMMKVYGVVYPAHIVRSGHYDYNAKESGYRRCIKVPETELTWRRREIQRAGRFKLVPWAKEDWWRESGEWAIHYPRPSVEDPTKIVYTPDVAAGENDRQIRTTPGRYLRKFFGDVLTETEIQEWALKYANTFALCTLHFGYSREDFRTIYETGPESCMSRRAENYETDGIHPCEVYAAGDLAIAYILGSEAPFHPVENVPVGRALVWPEKKIYSRVYGDIHRMKAALIAAGYTDGSLDGARCLKLTNGVGQTIAPYIDGDASCLKECGGGLIISYNGDPASQTHGLLYVGTCCEGCGGYYDEDDMSADPRGDNFYCESCWDERFASCDACCGSHSRDDLICVGDGDTYCPDCYSKHYAECEDCGDETYRDDLVWDAEDGIDVCQDCAERLRGEREEAAREKAERKAEP